MTTFKSLSLLSQIFCTEIFVMFFVVLIFTLLGIHRRLRSYSYNYSQILKSEKEPIKRWKRPYLKVKKTLFEGENEHILFSIVACSLLAAYSFQYDSKMIKVIVFLRNVHIFKKLVLFAEENWTYIYFWNFCNLFKDKWIHLESTNKV
jgi:hypothetical protein